MGFGEYETIQRSSRFGDGGAPLREIYEVPFFVTSWLTHRQETTGLCRLVSSTN